jgi:hypothetical protein
VDHVDGHGELAVFERNGADGDSVCGLVNTVEGGGESAVFGRGDVEDEVEFRAAGVEDALPVADDCRLCVGQR